MLYFTAGLCVSGPAGDPVLWSDSPGGGSSAEDCGEGRSHHLLREGSGRRRGDAPRAHGQKRTILLLERRAVLSTQLREAQNCVCLSFRCRVIEVCKYTSCPGNLPVSHLIRFKDIFI